MIYTRLRRDTAVPVVDCKYAGSGSVKGFPKRDNRIRHVNRRGLNGVDTSGTESA
jgi:hypothetical protein